MTEFRPCVNRGLYSEQTRPSANGTQITQRYAQSMTLMDESDFPDAMMLKLLDALPDAVLLVDHLGRIQANNRIADELFGYAHGELLGRPVEVLIPERLQFLVHG